MGLERPSVVPVFPVPTLLAPGNTRVKLQLVRVGVAQENACASVPSDTTTENEPVIPLGNTMVLPVAVTGKEPITPAGILKRLAAEELVNDAP